jgi:hypothetical protein
MSLYFSSVSLLCCSLSLSCLISQKMHAVPAWGVHAGAIAPVHGAARLRHRHTALVLDLPGRRIPRDSSEMRLRSATLPELLPERRDHEVSPLCAC